MSPRSEDRGCRLADEFLGRKSKCEECPFPRCIDGTGVSIATIRRESRAEKVSQMSSWGYGTSDIASTFGISIRTVHRDLKGRR